jgi:hypothetical protein
MNYNIILQKFHERILEKGTRILMSTAELILSERRRLNHCHWKGGLVGGRNTSKRVGQPLPVWSLYLGPAH